MRKRAAFVLVVVGCVEEVLAKEDPRGRRDCVIHGLSLRRTKLNCAHITVLTKENLTKIVALES
jgi:hypothetical protein